MKDSVPYYIIGLLHEYKRVSIPGVGSLKLYYHPASLSQNDTEIQPPRHSARFFQKTENDGLLAEYIKYKSGKRLGDCKRSITAFSKQLLKEVKKNKSFEVAGLGTFIRGGKNILKFKPEENGINRKYVHFEPYPNIFFEPTDLPDQAVEEPQTTEELKAAVINVVEAGLSDDAMDISEEISDIRIGKVDEHGMPLADADPADEVKIDTSEEEDLEAAVVPVITPTADTTDGSVDQEGDSSVEDDVTAPADISAYGVKKEVSDSKLSDDPEELTELGAANKVTPAAALHKIEKRERNLSRLLLWLLALLIVLLIILLVTLMTESWPFSNKGPSPEAQEIITDQENIPTEQEEVSDQLTDEGQTLQDEEQAQEQVQTNNIDEETQADEILEEESTSEESSPDIESSTVETSEGSPIESVTGPGRYITLDNIPAGYDCAIVVGAFSQMSNVERMGQALLIQGYQYVIIPPNGGHLTRVGIISKCDRANVLPLLREARGSISPDAWIYNIKKGQ